MDDILELFCLADDFCQLFLPEWESHLLDNGLKKRNRPGKLSISEIMTIIIHFHRSHYRTFKHYYLCHVRQYLKHLFPNLVSYERIVALTKSVIVPLCFLMQNLTGEETGCAKRRINNSR